MAQPAPPNSAPVEISLPDPLPWPAVACTPDELGRLRAAYADSGPRHEVVAKRVAAAERALGREVVFPPEGGQHNQWYQCDRCQIALKTVDDTHHRCPTCGEVYTGYPYDNLIYSRRHHRLTRDLEACGWAFALTGEERFAHRAREILLGYAERYREYPYHSANMGKRTDAPSGSGGHVYEQTLNESSWMDPVCTGYDLVRTSQVLSPADHASIRDGLLVPVYESIAANRAGKSNWQTYHNSAFILMGGVLGDVDLVRQAILDPENGFLYQTQVSVLPGGMWYENSWSYHSYTLGAIERILETARRLEIDLYSTPGVRDMYTVALDYRMPDQTLPRLGDAVTGGIPASRYESAYHAWRDPAMLALLPEDPTWEAVLFGRTETPTASAEARSSVLKEAAGHGILRADGAEGQAAAVLTFGPFGGFHGHFDKLSFAYFAMGRELGYDPGRSASQASTTAGARC